MRFTNGDIAQIRSVGDYYFVIIKRNRSVCVLIIDVNMHEIINFFEFITECYISSYGVCHHDSKLSFAISHNIRHKCITIIELDIYGNIKEYDLHENIIFKKKINWRTNKTFIFEEYILCHINCCGVYIYNYIKKELVGVFPFDDEILIKGFVKLKNLKKNVKMENMYSDEETKDVYIKTKGETIKAHKNVLIKSSEYFEKLFSNNFFERNTIEFDADYDVVISVLKYMYTQQVDDNEYLNNLLNIYYFCDEILLTELKDKVEVILFEKYFVDKNMTHIKIYDKETLKNLSNAFKIIKFDKDFNENIDGLINEGVEKLIFGKSFNHDINHIPESVKEIYVSKNWNCKIGDFVNNNVLIIKNKKIRECELYTNNNIVSSNRESDFKKYIKKNNISKGCLIYEEFIINEFIIHLYNYENETDEWIPDNYEKCGYDKQFVVYNAFYDDYNNSHTKCHGFYDRDNDDNDNGFESYSDNDSECIDEVNDCDSYDSNSM